MECSSLRNNRDSGIELLRILCMLMILFHHCIAHYIGSATFSDGYYPPTFDNIFIVAFNPVLYCAVNVFVLISGWYGINLKLKRVTGFYVECACYVAVLFFFHRFVEGFPVGKSSFVHEVVFVFSHCSLWFVRTYLGLMLLAPLLNAAVSVLSRPQFRAALLSLTIINVYFGWYRGFDFNLNGFCLAQFVYLYIIGRYLKLFSRIKDYRRGTLAAGFFTCAMVLGVMLCYFAFVSPNQHWEGMLGIKYNNPILIAQSVFLLLIFTSLKFKSSIVNLIASSSLAVYFFHWHRFAPSIIKRTVVDNFSIWPEGWRWLYLSGYLVALYLILTLVGIVLRPVITSLNKAVSNLLGRIFRECPALK